MNQKNEPCKPMHSFNLSVAAIKISSTASPDIQSIHDALIDKALDALEWYGARQRTKKLGARIVRSTAILFGALTAIIPSILAMLPDKLLGEFSVIRLNPIATITGIIAATAILFDRFYGFSSSWGRYMVTYQRIQKDLEDFEIEWSKCLTAVSSNNAQTDEHRLSLYELANAFVKKINDAIRAETDAWLSDFKSVIGDVDKSIQTSLAESASATSNSIAKKGAISLSLSNVELLDGAKWTMQLENRNEEEKVGQSTAVLSALDPGMYRVRITATRAGRSVASELVAIVKAGEVVSVKVENLG